MANIRIDLGYTIKDGSEVVFRSPVDCSAITGLIVYYPGTDGATTSKVFALSDAHGNNVGDIDHLFAENVVVKVILDVTSGMAFVQNADTNAYIEGTFVKSVNNTKPDENGNVTIDVSAEVEEALAAAKKSGDFDGPKGDTGAAGKDGVSATHSWNGTTLTISSASGTSSADLKGPKGDTGAAGKDGASGKTPVKGTDYFTDADIAEFLKSAAPAGYGYGGTTININDDNNRIDSEAELTTALSAVYDQMNARETKFVAWNGYPAAGTSTHGWFGILTKSSANNGGITAWSAYNAGSLIRKSKYSGSWNPLEWENPPMIANEAHRTTERINGNAVFKMADNGGNVWYALDDDGPWRSYSDLVGSNSIKNLVEQITTSGYIASGQASAVAGKEISDTGYVRSGYIAVSKGDIIKYSNMNGAKSVALILVYNSDKTLLEHPRVNGTGNTDYYSSMITITEDGYVRLSNRKAVLSTAKVELHEKVKGNILPRKTLNILVIGNSFSQDAFSYLPPVLNEILPDYAINYGIAYEGGCSIEKHYKMLTDPDSLYDEEDNPKPAYYDRFNSWNAGEAKWTRSSPMNTVTLTDIMAMRTWDIIYVQPEGAASKVSSDVIAPARKLLRELQKLNGGPFSFMMGQWLATRSNVKDDEDFGQAVYKSLCTAMQTVKQQVGIADYIPIGTAFQFARTNSTFRGLGNSGNMIHDISYSEKDANKQDGGHMQAGLPALLATYTVALKILECIGESHRGIYGSSFVPTRDVCIAIGAYKDEGMVSPLPMTHGDPDGVTYANIRAAQEIAVLAVNYPTADPPIDCSGIIV